MLENKIDGASLKECFLAAASLLDNNKKQLNDLNVFPVPDGDTGTNMSLTMKSIIKEIQSVTDITVPAIASAAARGALKGARGNSGVILSQLFRGFSMPLSNVELIDAITFANCLKQGVEMAYKAVMKPKEGTILTVARIVADECFYAAKRGANIFELSDITVKAGQATLAKTPDMLPVLKKAGVVDAGGQGLLIIYTAFNKVIHGEYVENIIEDTPLISAAPIQQAEQTSWPVENDLENITFAYCTEFFIHNLFDFVTEKEIDKLRKMLSNIGDSLVVVGDTSLVKIHVHTNTPGKALQYALQLGELDGIKIDNMVRQHREVLAKKKEAEAEPPKEIGVAAVVAGEGLSAIFKDIGVDSIISGGQTMNPSTENILDEITKINAKNIIILPNNSNIILTAQQVQDLTDKKIYVVPTKTIPQGIAAMLAYNPEADAQQNFENMNEAFGSVKTGLVTYAVRNTSFGNQDINEGDILGLSNGDIVATGSDITQTAFDTISKIFNADENDLITIYYGQEISEEDANALAERVSQAYPDADVDVHSGGQPVYYYIVSVE